MAERGQDVNASSIEKFAEHVWVRLLSRAAIMICAGALPPLSLWVISSVNTTLKELSVQGTETVRTLDKLSQRVDHNFTMQTTSNAQVEAKIEGLKIDLRERTSGSYNKEDAAKDFRYRDQRLDQHDLRLDRIEGRK